jgi:hypothetical protein
MKTARLLVLGGALALGGAAVFLIGQVSRTAGIADVPIAEIAVGTMSLAARSTLNSGAIDREMAIPLHGLMPAATNDA